MRAVLQRVAEASVTVEGEIVGVIGRGILALIGVEQGDGPGDVAWMARKIADIRMFDDADGKMNCSVEAVDGEILLVSQFTLCADCRKGRRPGFTNAAEPDRANRLYEEVADALRSRGLKVETGRFQAMMDVRLINAGPVTFILDSPPKPPTGNLS